MMIGTMMKTADANLRTLFPRHEMHETAQAMVEMTKWMKMTGNSMLLILPYN
jgi:hypothetical protein